MPPIPTLRERSLAGAAFLDNYLPSWYRMINAERLDLGCYCNCILGQIAGNYGNGQKDFAITESMAISYGFFAGIRNRRKRRFEYRILTMEWRERIAERILAETAEVADEQPIASPKKRAAVYVIAVTAINIFLSIFMR